MGHRSRPARRNAISFNDSFLHSDMYVRERATQMLEESFESGRAADFRTFRRKTMHNPIRM
jgi:hypothetical protein